VNLERCDCNTVSFGAPKAMSGRVQTDKTRRVVFLSVLGRVITASWDWLGRKASIHSGSARARGFHSFGDASLIMWPHTTIFNEAYISIGSGVLIGKDVALSAGMVPGQQCLTKPVVTIGDRCLIGRGSGIVGHLSIVIGNDVWTGHHVYITDQNHDYRDVTRPISQQSQPERAVSIGDGSWIGHGSIVLPGATIGRHVVIGANSVVTSSIPDRSVAVGSPARVIKRHIEGVGWTDV